MIADAIVLLVEEEPIVREIMRDALLDAGFEVVEVASGREALSFLNGRTPVHALVTDIRLAGGPDGWAVARATREFHPFCSVIYISGCVPGALEMVPGSVFLSKPLQVASRRKELLPNVLQGDPGRHSPRLLRLPSMLRSPIQSRN